MGPCFTSIGSHLTRVSPCGCSLCPSQIWWPKTAQCGTEVRTSPTDPAPGSEGNLSLAFSSFSSRPNHSPGGPSISSSKGTTPTSASTTTWAAFLDPLPLHSVL